MGAAIIYPPSWILVMFQLKIISFKILKNIDFFDYRILEHYYSVKCLVNFFRDHLRPFATSGIGLIRFSGSATSAATIIEVTPSGSKMAAPIYFRSNTGRLILLTSL